MTSSVFTFDLIKATFQVIYITLHWDYLLLDYKLPVPLALISLSQIWLLENLGTNELYKGHFSLKWL